MLPWAQEELRDFIDKHPERTYLDAEPKHKRRLIQLGAKWDKKCPREDGADAKRGKWWINEDEVDDVADFARWLPEEHDEYDEGADSGDGDDDGVYRALPMFDPHASHQRDYMKQFSERVYLSTEFHEKEKVKAMGARWDPECPRDNNPGGLWGKWYVDETDSYAEPIQRFAKWLPEDHEDYDSNVSDSDDERADSDDDPNDSIASMQPRVSSPARKQTARRSAPAVAPKTPSPSKPSRASLLASGVQQRKRARGSN